MTAYGVADVDRILAIAQRVPVFPCGPDKRPLVASGFHAATQDERQVRQWWARWPDALVGVPTGQTTGLVVVDYDPDKATQATHSWLADHTELLTGTRVHTTGRNGRHYLFRTTDRYQTGTDLVLGGSPRKGIDLRANGGYVIWWPAHGCQVVGETIAPLPAGLIDERLFRPERDLAPLPHTAPPEWSHESPKVIAALRYIDPDGYEQWIRVGMAIHHASGGSDEGFAVWHEWSTRGNSYDGIEDCRYHWSSFGGYAGRGLGLGSLFSIAKAGGYSTQPEPPADDRFPPIDAYAADDHAAEPETTGEPKRKAAMTLRHIAEIVAEKREAEWLLHKVLEANVLAVLAGQRGTFKSFIALDWAMRVALQDLPVVMLSGEGAGLDRRVDAWCRTHRPDTDLAAVPLYALERPVNLRLAVEIAELSEAIKSLPKPPSLVVVDTFSKFSAGIDENDNGEVSAFLSGLSEFLRDEFRCTVLLVAHAGHGDAKRPRGASALMANPDAEYIVERPVPTGMAVTVSRERFKDSPAYEALSYEGRSVDLGRYDAYGEPVTSLALVSAAPPAKSLRQPAGAAQRKLLTGLRNLQRDAPTRLFWTVAELRSVARSAGVTKQSAHDAAEALVMHGFVVPVAGSGYALPPDEVQK